jgi:Mor family transcriptional regulator
MSIPVKITRNTLTLEKKLQLIKDFEVHNKKNVDLAKKYKISKNSVSEILKNGPELKIFDSLDNGSLASKNIRPI